MKNDPIDPRYCSSINQALSRHRRAIASQSPEQFAKVYLAAEFHKEPSRMHLEVFQALKELHGEPGACLAIAGPRGHAKSTIATLAFPLWATLCQDEAFILLVSATELQAQRLLEHVRRQFEENPLLRIDFPELLEAEKGTPWRGNALLLPNGQMIMAFSPSQNPRGVRNDRHRPTLIIADDLEDRNSVASEDLRTKLSGWFNATLLKTGNPDTKVVVVGNLLHEDSLLAGLLDRQRSPEWKALRYQAVERFSKRQDLWDMWGRIHCHGQSYHEDQGPKAAKAFFAANHEAMMEGAAVLWPQEYSYEKLMRVRKTEGEAIFKAEFQNEPLDPSSCVFASSAMTYWDDRPMTASQFLHSRGYRYGVDHCGEFFGACDPSLGSHHGKGDFTAIIVLFRPRSSKQVFVLEADIERRSPDETMERIAQLGKQYVFTNFVVESNNFQRVLFSALKAKLERETYCRRVEAVVNRTHKIARIKGLQPAIAGGGIVFSRKHERLLSQLNAYPTGKHDDGPDALEMAYVASQRTCAITWMWI